MPVLLALILGSVLMASAQDLPRAVVDPPSWDFGYLPQKSEVSHLFYLHNAGSGPLNVSKIRAVCSCTSASGFEGVIAPGDSAAFLVTLRSGRYEHRIKKPIYAHSDDPENPAMRLHVLAYVAKEDEPTGNVDVEPRKMKWKIDDGRISIHEDSLTIVNSGQGPLTASVLSAPDSIVSAVDLPVEIAPKDTSEAILHISAKPGLSELKGLSITLAFAGQDTTIITIPIEIED